MDKVHFHKWCPHCGRDIYGEEIVEISIPSMSQIFLYTENDHQLCYENTYLMAVHCEETEKGDKYE